MNKTYIIPFALLFLISGVYACQSSPQKENRLTKDEVIKTIREYDDAWSKKDTSKIVSILATDYIYFSSQGNIRSRQWMVEELLGNPSYQMESSNRNELTIKIHQNTAIVGSHWQGSGTYNGEPVEDNQRCSQVFVKEKGHLYLVSEHCTEIE